jgi:glycosyltransferase involved in cell wall biosynthesis
MKILFLTHAQYITIALPKIIEQAEVLAGMGHEVTLVATSRKNIWKMETFYKNGVRYIISPSVLPGNWRHGADVYDAYRRAYFITRHFDYDIIHAVDSRPAVILPALFLKKVKKVPLILEWMDLFSNGGTIKERSSNLYGATIGKIESFFEMGFRNRADGAVALTSYLKNQLIDRGFDRGKIHLHRMGCTVDGTYLTEKQTARTKLNLSPGSIIIGYIGKIYKRDYALLVDSFLLLKELRSDARLVIIGSRLAGKKVQHPDIIHTGYLSEEIFNLYCNAFDFFVLPLRKNPMNTARWPSKISDYFRFAKPVVTTDVSDFKKIFSEHEIGIVSGDTPEEFSSAMDEMIRNRERWEAFGRNAYAYAKEHLSWFHICDNLIRFYERILDNEYSFSRSESTVSNDSG